MADFLAGYRVYLGAFGLVILGLFQLWEKQFESAFETFSAALIAFGLKRANIDVKRTVIAAAPPSTIDKTAPITDKS